MAKWGQQTGSCDMRPMQEAQEGHLPKAWGSGRTSWRSGVLKKEGGRCTRDPRPPVISAAATEDSLTSTDSPHLSRTVPGLPAHSLGLLQSCRKRRGINSPRDTPKTQAGAGGHMLQPFALQPDTPGSLCPHPRGPLSLMVTSARHLHVTLSPAILPSCPITPLLSIALPKTHPQVSVLGQALGNPDSDQAQLGER